MKLKFMIAAFASCLLSLQASMAQVPTVWDNCSERGIKTNPKAPVNLHDTTKVNTFNWLLKEFPVNGVLISQIESPFFQPDNTETYPLRISQDQASGGGWELIKQGLGFVSLGVPGLNKIKRPYYILYNKYTAIMRVFFAGSTDLRSDTDFTAAQILLSFAPTSYQSSALMLANAPVAILDNFTKNQEMVSGTAFNNDLAKWVYADFPMTYDPCACNFKSALYAELKLVRTAQINMLGLSQGTLMSISNGQGSVNQKASKWTLQNAIGAGKKASQTYNSIGEFTNKQLEEIKNAEKDDKTELPLRTAKEKQDALNYFSKKLFDNKFLQDGLKAIPYIGAAVSFLDSFFGGGATAPQEVKMMPMAINMTTTYTGTISNESTQGKAIFDTPGSKDAGASLASEYPIYNEAMGTFTVLTLPKVNSVTHKVNYSGTVVPITADYAKVYSLADELRNNMKYALNPASGLNADSIEIKAALVFDFDNEPTKIIRSLNGNMELETKTPTTIRYRSPYMPLSMINNVTTQYGFRAGDSLVAPPPTTISTIGGVITMPALAYPITAFNTPNAVF